jgi:hypothetical protein
VSAVRDVATPVDPEASARRGRRVPASDAAVSDVVGSILLAAITVGMSTILGILLFTFAGPTPTLQAELVVRIDPGSVGWGSGDERIEVLHRGGDPVLAENARISVRVGGTTTTYCEQGPPACTASLGSTFADGKLTIGETWFRTLNIPSGASVQVDAIVDNPATTQLLSTERLVANAVTTSPLCGGDTFAPTALTWIRSPGNVTALYTGNVTVTAVLTDDCWGVNPNVIPSLEWRIGNGSFNNVGAMTPVGFNQWRGVIPAQPWSSHVGSLLQYHAGPVMDLGGNVGNTADHSTTILADCSQDTTPPTITSLTHSPADVRSDTPGAVNVTIVANDGCVGVDEANLPVLRYRINDGTNPAYTIAAPMTFAGNATWTGTIPSPPWSGQAEKTLEYYVNEVRDKNGNMATSVINSDLVEGVYTYTYVNSFPNPPAAGTVTSFSNSQSASDSGAASSLTERGTPQLQQTLLFNANSVVSSTDWTNPGNVYASDDVYATTSPTCTNNAFCPNGLRVAVQDPATGQSGAITAVIVRAEVSVSPFSNDGFGLQACVTTQTPQCNTQTGALTGSGTDIVLSYDVTNLRPGGGAWTWSNIRDLEVIIFAYQSASKDGTWRVDRINVEVTYETTQYDMQIRHEFSGVPAGGGTRILQLRYYTNQADTFVVRVCQDSNPTCGTWTTRGTILNASSFTNWSYTLTAAEYNSGSPRIRFHDSDATGISQGILYLDYVRVATL